MNRLVSLWHTLVNYLRARLASRPGSTLAGMVDEARLAWREALNEYNFADQEMVDYLVFKINAAERRFIALLHQARRQGVTAWPPNLPGPVTGVHDACSL
ncbi:hypothetical protein [Desulfotomaculum copahuensis]|uniref:DUF2508 domain-containing protein n=1 Tax=Desulfotomaculum copahuensis TaxID=1838280 RepID=A0A1B7LC04_9FIRM|nr:hypothetical protein [Desulfotomaculum copahuensis]OAT80209.1 hypothetical protein A6M21_00950 [Desulfotomaculum copahuensis]